jgi:hypothetical protein
MLQKNYKKKDMFKTTAGIFQQRLPHALQASPGIYAKTANP